MRWIVAVDGPAAAGKGTLAKSLAAALGLPHLDTGLLYRAVARKMLLSGLNPASDDGTLSASQLEASDLARNDLRVPEIDAGASSVASQPGVRAALLQRQRDFAKQSGAVVDGRDIGTVVFPDADLKLFVTASPAIRARRRFYQIHGHLNYDETILHEIARQIEARDQKDAERHVSPLRQAPDAILIATDDLDAQNVLDRALALVHQRRQR